MERDEPTSFPPTSVQAVGPVHTSYRPDRTNPYAVAESCPECDVDSRYRPVTEPATSCPTHSSRHGRPRSGHRRTPESISYGGEPFDVLTGRPEGVRARERIRALLDPAGYPGSATVFIDRVIDGRAGRAEHTDSEQGDTSRR